jgi:hypothetical protein
MNSNQFGPFLVERAKGGGYQIRNTETGSINTRSSIKEARLAAYQSFVRWQDRQRQAARS